MREAFIFDVDGTLTPSRQKIDAEFAEYFLEFCNKNDVYLVTGSDRQKTLEQVGKEIYEACLGVYQCNGNELWKKTYLAKKTDWRMPYKLEKYLTNFVYKSPYPFKVGRHIELRTGMVNFSVVGRGANDELRQAYYNWDKEHKEREKVVYELGKRHPELTAVIGGMISVDIYPKKADKSQIVGDFDDYDRLYFFGDRIEDRGNDQTLATVIRLGNRGEAFQVNDWTDTWNRIKDYDRK